MAHETFIGLKARQLAETALSRWENEGGAGMPGLPCFEAPAPEAGDTRPLGDAELSQLHVRIVALEGLVTALLADASDRQLDLVRKMAAYITPRPGSTRHPLTIRAAMQMIDLLERSGRSGNESPGDPGPESTA